MRHFIPVVPKTALKFQSTHSITECDPLPLPAANVPGYFNPRTPLQSATARRMISANSLKSFQSTHSITECDNPDLAKPTFTNVISIHALHYRVRQARLKRDEAKMQHFNPRTPLQSATDADKQTDVKAYDFNPRTPLQSATQAICQSLTGLSFQSTHSITECDHTRAFSSLTI